MPLNGDGSGGQFAVFGVFGLESMNAVVPVSIILSLLAAAGIIYGSIMAIGQFEIDCPIFGPSPSGYIVTC